MASIMNGLNYLHDNNDITEITPSHLIVARNLPENMSNANIDYFDITKDECTRRCKHLKTTVEHFWRPI